MFWGMWGGFRCEKNVALLARVERELAAMGMDGVRFLIVGHGGEEAALRAELKAADFAGVLRGVELARAYADMDVLVFPSHTDTFGNVVLEALASGVPAVVTPDGGPKFILRDGKTGFVAGDDGFAGAVAALVGVIGRGYSGCVRVRGSMRWDVAGMRCLGACMRGIRRR